MSEPANGSLSMHGDVQQLLAAYAQHAANGASQAARQMLVDALAQASEDDVLTCGRSLVLRGDLPAATDVFEAGANRMPDSGDLHVGLAGLLWQMQQTPRAEEVLQDWLQRHPDHGPATFLLARLLREQGRMQAAADAVRQLFAQGEQDADTVIQAAELLDDYLRPADAAAICEAAIAAGSTDPRIHAYAGMLAIQLGNFDRVRERYCYALAHEPQAIEWNIPIGLSGLQRYRDANHSDFALFEEVIRRKDISDGTRTTTLFALGKACDDIGDYGKAAGYLSEANARAHAGSTWSRKHWKRLIESRLAAAPYSESLHAPTDWTPVFIVGVPRSGTTLLAELLARHPGVCNRGELGWLSVVAQRLSMANHNDRSSLEDAARLYAAQLRQDDSQAHWFIDKQPLNLLHVDLIMALWPNARIVYCQRDARDTALSLWSQSFHDRAHDYAYDFQDIAAVIQGCKRLITHWQQCYPASIHSVPYEALVAAPDEHIAALVEWLGVPSSQRDADPQPDRGISTASAWQARQPVYTRSSGRWRHYAPYLPDLLKVPEH
jgi:thioredoxin-like negative regulator of GroEL